MAATPDCVIATTLDQERYIIDDFVQVSLTLKSPKGGILLRSMSFEPIRGYIPRNVTSESAYPAKLEIIISEKDYRLLENNDAIELDESSIVKNKMALITVWETDEKNYSPELQKHFPDAIRSNIQYYYEQGTIAAHKGHPCGYKFFVPLDEINAFETGISKFKGLMCKSKCIVFKLKVQKEREYDFSLIIRNADARVQVKDSGERLVCSIPIDIATNLYLYFIANPWITDIDCAGNDSFIETVKRDPQYEQAQQKGLFMQALYVRKNEQEALHHFNTGLVSPDDCVLPQRNGVVHPLLLAAEKGMASLSAALLKAGANPQPRLRNGLTPLFISAQEGYSNVVEALLHHKADAHIAFESTAESLTAFAKSRPEATQRRMARFIEAKIQAGESKYFITILPLQIACITQLDDMRLIQQLFEYTHGSDYQQVMDTDTPARITGRKPATGSSHGKSFFSLCDAVAESQDELFLRICFHEPEKYNQQSAATPTNS